MVVCLSILSCAAESRNGPAEASLTTRSPVTAPLRLRWTLLVARIATAETPGSVAAPTTAIAPASMRASARSVGSLTAQPLFTLAASEPHRGGRSLAARRHSSTHLRSLGAA